MSLRQPWRKRSTLEGGCKIDPFSVHHQKGTPSPVREEQKEEMGDAFALRTAAAVQRRLHPVLNPFEKRVPRKAFLGPLDVQCSSLLFCKHFWTHKTLRIQNTWTSGCPSLWVLSDSTGILG